MRILGSLSGTTTFSVRPDKLVELSRTSATNRMLFFYLHSLGTKNLGKLVSLYENEQTSYMRTNDAIARASQILTNANIEHAFFKTIRPYTSTTVDLDILIFGENGDHAESVNVMEDAGYELVMRGPRSTTLRDKEANIGVDVYSEVAVSLITYMDKRTLSPYVTTTNLPNGEYVKILEPEADLSCIIAHSIIKEQMYTLSEYYTFIHYLKQMSIDNFLQIVKQSNMTSAARAHASITALLHKTAHKSIPSELQQILKKLGQDNFETTRITRRDFETPHKYHPITVARSLLEIAKGTKSRNSMAMQIYQMTHPSFSSKFLKALMEHVLRETY
jgi:hypothetical protein